MKGLFGPKRFKKWSKRHYFQIFFRQTERNYLITIRKLMKKMVFSFKDGTKDDYDVIIYCTGYLHRFPFMEDRLQLHCNNTFAVPLYKQVLFPHNKQLFYIGMQVTWSNAGRGSVNEIVLIPIKRTNIKQFLVDLNKAEMTNSSAFRFWSTNLFKLSL